MNFHLPKWFPVEIVWCLCAMQKNKRNSGKAGFALPSLFTSFLPYTLGSIFFHLVFLKPFRLWRKSGVVKGHEKRNMGNAHVKTTRNRHASCEKKRQS